VAKGEKAGVSSSLADVPNDLSFLVGIRQRVRLPGNGPRALCLAGDKAVAGMYFSDDLAVVSLADAMMPAKTVALGAKAPLSQARMGEMYFNDGQFCFQSWQSCASCHPDGRADGLNWDLLNDGIGNPKNTRNMLLCFQTPPSMSLGIRDSADVASSSSPYGRKRMRWPSTRISRACSRFRARIWSKANLAHPPDGGRRSSNARGVRSAIRRPCTPT
jgi:hypothetical protein